MFIGDWPERDVKGAKSIGMKTVFARYGYDGQGKAVHADYKAMHFKDLIEILKK